MWSGETDLYKASAGRNTLNTRSFTPLIHAFSKPGELVLDPFCGSGSSLVAARDLGRAYIGIELTHRYHQIAASRLGLATAA